MFSYPATAEVLKKHYLSDADKEKLKKKIKKLLKKENATLLSHYYVSSDIQQITEETGGIVSDSLEMAKFGFKSDSNILIVAGVAFMGESAKILSPHKQVLMPTLDAICSLDISCPIDEFSNFCDKYPGREIVVYANTSAAVKARADWVVTSSIALDVIKYLHSKNKKIIWAPDKYLGEYVHQESRADMLLWDGSCIVHEEFKSHELKKLKIKYPQALILAHPESPMQVLSQADIIGSTTTLINAVKENNNKVFIIATDDRIFYQMKKYSKNKKLIAAPTAGDGATCHSCAHCPWMAMNDLQNLYYCLKNKQNEIKIDKNIIKQAQKSLKKMLNF
ncbi:MAG: quinolinate synthase [Gammaproteobacteria bacterium]|nr:MAG: quinolinate synthase [Gammaproteobacteria bacterium]